MRLSKEEVHHIASLIRLGLTEEEIERMQDQLSSILENFEALKQVDTEGVEPTGHSVALDTVLREDEAADSYSREDILSNAPSREGDFFKVRAVLE